jgi:glycosyltransferase involved in cell wall biosynthesis
MRILIVHNAYQQAGGEDAAVENERDLLRAAGHDVALSTVSNDSIDGYGDRLQTALHAAYSPFGLEWMRKRIDEFRPDIVQSHNLFPQLTPSVYDACAEAGVPVVQTLHNFRVTCAAATLLRDGVVCEKCVSATPYWGALHRCYRGSPLGSLVAAHMIDFHRRRGTWRDKVSMFFALTAFAREKFIAAGLPAARITVKPNYTPPTSAPPSPNRRGALFVGRLSAEKGLASLLQAWNGIDYPLTIVGDGPLRQKLSTPAAPNIVFRGKLGADAVAAEMARAAFLIVPSIWYEMLPMVIIEAFAAGLPVFGSRIGGLSETIGDEVNGRLFAAGDADDMARVVRGAIGRRADLERLGQTARRTYEARYSAKAVLRLQIAAYESLLTASRKNSPSLDAQCQP